jgi:peptidoglycan/LPS O-acetylase OafA/YrhL
MQAWAGMQGARPVQRGELLRHVDALDGLRFFAFLAVYVHHAGQNRPRLRDFTEYGGLGVQVFFVLSGFLIGSILWDLRGRTQVPLKTRLYTFYARRGLRIFPLYYFALLALFPLPYLGFNTFGVPGDLPWNLAYLTNVRMVLTGLSMGGMSHFWSLSVEEHFYIVAPIIVLKLCLVTWIACAAGRAYLGPDYGAASVLSPFQFDCLLFGIAAAVLRADGSFLGLSRGAALKLAALCGAVAIPALLGRHARDPALRGVALTVEQFAVAWATAGVILYLWDDRGSLLARFLSLRPFIYLGKISYGLYLWHFPVLLLTSVMLAGVLSRGSSVVALFLTIAVATLSFFLIERPFTNLKRYVAYQ